MRRRSSPTDPPRDTRACQLSDPLQRQRRAELRVVRRHEHDLRAGHGLVEPQRRRRHVRIVDRHIGELALQQAHELVGQRVALVVGVGLEGQPEHGDLAARQLAEPALDPLDEEVRHGLVDARDGQQHAGRRGALLGEREVLAQAGAGGEAGPGDPAARIVAVDEVDDLEDVRPVLVAVHHQQVGQRELRVADDVRPDLRELGLDRRRLHDPRAEDLEQARRRTSPDALADAADDAGQRRDLLEEVPGGDALRAMGDEQLLADLEARGAWRCSPRRTPSCPARSSSAA